MIEPLASPPEATLPALVQADAQGLAGNPESLSAWCGENWGAIEGRLRESGALLFRGFGVARQEDFEAVTRALPGRVVDYVDGNSPRKKLGSGVYTSTEYPPEFFISLHNELSYAERWPSLLVFGCMVAPAEGGETPLADSREILAHLAPEVVEAFRAKQVKYIRNLHGGRGFGPSWQTTFETADRAAVEDYCRAHGVDFHWDEDGGLCLEHVRPALAVHPGTGETVWFNQADQFHPSTHDKQLYDSLMLLYKNREDRLPQNARFGDDSPIPVEMLRHIRETTRRLIRKFPWREGDLLVVDNLLACHGRMPFRGPRKILVAMKEL